MISTTVILTIFLAMALAPVAMATTSFAELDVQVYKGEGAVGIIVSELNSGFDVTLDENSKVTVAGNNVSSDDGIVGGGSTNTTPDNVTSVADEEAVVIEIPHIGNVTDNGENGTYVQNNITSSTEVINDVTGGNITEPAAVVVTENETSSTTERDCIGGILTEGYSVPTDFEICYI